MTREQAVSKLTGLISQIEGLKGLNYSNTELTKWRRDVQIALEQIFGNSSRHHSDFNSISFRPSSYGMFDPDPAFRSAYLRGLQNSRAILESMVQEVEEYWKGPTDQSPSQGKSETRDNLKVFIVHGRDEAVKEGVARLVQRLGLSR